MSTLPSLSALDPGPQIFPSLTRAQCERVRPLGELRDVAAGEVLFRPGEVGIPFFVVISGEMEIVQPAIVGERLVTTHHRGEFTGELSMLNGRPALVLARMKQAGQVLQLSVQALRALIARDAELSEVIMRAYILRRLALISNKLGNVIVLGSQHSADTLRVREFLARNLHPYTFVDLDVDKSSQELLDRFNVQVDDVPLVICDGKTVFRHPTTQEVAKCLGLNADIDGAEAKDVIIIGAGPAGLAAAVYAASEGLNALLVETEAPGGQAGSSSKIENYLGFPTGVSGQELANRAIHQAEKFGAQLIVARSITGIRCEQHPYQVMTDDGATLYARTIVIATGAQYNKPKLDNLQKFEGLGIYYSATYIESQLCEGEEVIVIGGGNSAGQAAAFLSQTVAKVHMLVRSDSLSETMSRYLIQRITENPKIDVHVHSQIEALHGESHLSTVEWVDKSTGERTTKPIRHVFVMAGASPRTDWLRGCVALDEKGFVLTGRDLNNMIAGETSSPWPLKRPPQMLETSLPGVFAVGDVRAGSVKRVASAVGEGAIAVSLVHRTLTEM